MEDEIVSPVKRLIEERPPPLLPGVDNNGLLELRCCLAGLSSDAR